MKTILVTFVVCVLVIGGKSQAAIVSVDFDGPDYVAGQLPPEPWMQEYDGIDYSIEAEVGYDGTQGLVVTDDVNWAGVTYVLPTPLTSDMGAVRISILLNPPSVPSGWNFSDFGGLQVGRGSKRGGTAIANGLIFRLVNGNRGIYGPGSGIYGTNLGSSWTPGQWYEITFEVNEDWESMTIGAGPVGGEAVSDSFDWGGGQIDRIWVASPGNNSAIYDNLLITANKICPSGDLTGDCFVNLADVAVMARWWSDQCDEANNYCDGADLDLSGEVSIDDLLVIADQWLQGEQIEPPDVSWDMTWVSISNNGFNGEMSRYPTTNSQFAQYLNDALASGDIIVDGSYVKGNSGSYSGQDYYNMAGPGRNMNGATNGGASRINCSDGEFTVDSGFENHPVTYVSWYGATAFAEYYDWRLPTREEWKAVAGYTDGRTYPTGDSLYDYDSEKFLANYQANGHDGRTPNDLPYHPWFEHGTSEVGYFGIFGYGMADMAGNVYEFTSSVFGPGGSHRVITNGGWVSTERACEALYESIASPSTMADVYGFRVCR